MITNIKINSGPTPNLIRLRDFKGGEKAVFARLYDGNKPSLNNEEKHEVAVIQYNTLICLNSGRYWRDYSAAAGESWHIEIIPSVEINLN